MDVGAVLIGRNEGERLVRCLASIKGQVAHAVYVDSGSSDDSVANARRAGVEVISLDLSQPFTAARARNAGLEALLAARPNLTYVQFVDGDCEVQPGWIAEASAFLDANQQVAVACGRRRERFPEASIYNRLCDWEWDTPVGEVTSCGGDSLMRVVAVNEVGGFNATLICGEEPELCLRLRRAGWRIFRMDHEMTLHDAAMNRFGQWWRREIRAGWAYGEGFARYGDGPERYRVRKVHSLLFWGMLAPLTALILAFTIFYGFNGLAIYLLISLILLYVFSFLKNGLQYNNLGNDWLKSGIFAAFILLSKIPQFIGFIKYNYNTSRNRKFSIIEYK